MKNGITKDTIKELEELYNSGKYEEYSTLLIKNKENIDQGLFHYNLGSAFAKKGDIGAARYNLEASLKSGFSHPALLANLSTVRTKASEGIFLKKSNIESLKFTYATYGSGAFLSASLLCILIFVLLNRFKVINNKIALLVLLFLSFSPSLSKKYFDNKYDVAINVKPVQVFEGPSDIYESIRDLKAGQKLLINKSLENWVFIESPIQFSGWIKRTSVGFLRD